ncbi:type II toxin-antitoxin system HicA family toxin [Rivularia sp. UHCC 0363]|uniref:type II toxin-antitoxin system HicA family toxin n=1 Tax=Rivularia sp. UHCC 0363 TaxID=3110244 RepID=UPI002B2103AE|nr:type II toxin-antitoxin system HicA family toxin [Rivularia sp. UHCC 0363]MEA5593403.1 type II toxin-antitoxin system HicA family toxin [Rivularia sp. UHCC 0363]
MDLNNKQRQVLSSIFTNPIPANILWRDIKKLFVALGADISQGQGSRVRVKLNDVKAVFHEPHPEKETDK